MDLRHLRYFAAVAEERHFGRAARRLRIAQPPLSRQIQGLEAELGFRLLDRSSRRVELTAAGQVLLSHVRRIFTAVDLGVSEARRASLGQIGRVAVGYVSSLAYTGIAEMLRSFHQRHPDVELALRELPPQEQIASLKDGRLDVGFLRGPLDDPELTSDVLSREPLMAILPARHPLASVGRLELAALAKEPFVIFPRPRGAAFYDQIIAMCHAAGFTPRITQETPYLDLVSLVAAGFGVTILPRSIGAVARKGIVLRPIVGAPLVELRLTWRAADASPALRVFLDFVRAGGMKRVR